MLAREVLRLRGTIASREADWDVMVDLYFYRDPEAEENKEVAEEAKVPGADEVGAPAIDAGAFAGAGADWEVAGTAPTAFEGAAAVTAAGQSWDAEAAGEWAAAPAPAAGTTDWAADAKGEEW